MTTEATGAPDAGKSINLRAIAARLYRELEHTDRGMSAVMLPRGLHIRLGVANGDWGLKLARRRVEPSETEIAIARRAFNVPSQTPIAHRGVQWQFEQEWRYVIVAWKRTRELPVGGSSQPSLLDGTGGSV